MTVVDICRSGGLSDATFFEWRAKFGGVEASDARRLREQGENAGLKKMFAELALENAAIKVVLSRKL